MDFKFYYIISLLAGYLLGSIPFAVLIARAYSVNIFEQGSGNPGATNVLRSVGKKQGYLCFFFDALKGFVATSWLAFFLTRSNNAIDALERSIFSASNHEALVLVSIFGLVGALIGHSFSVFIKFRGGKAVATTVGGMLALSPWTILIAVLVWLVTFYTTRFVSLASILLGVSLPVTMCLLSSSTLSGKILAGALAILIVVRHRVNIQRLLNGTENRFSKK